jgi:hypothetical protein
VYLDLLGDLAGLASPRLGRLGGEELGLDGREDTTLRDDDVTEKLVELLVVSDGELEVSRDDSGLLVVPGSVTGELEDLGGEVWGHKRERKGRKRAKKVSPSIQSVRQRTGHEKRCSHSRTAAR